MTRRILFFTTAIEHSTFRKTAERLYNEGADVQMIGFTRDNYPASAISVPTESLGKIGHGNYIKRILLLIRFLRHFRKRGSEFDVIYTFTLDTLLISKISLCFKKKVYVYHIQDIRSVFFGAGIKSKLARFLEKSLIRYIDLLVVSSKDYYTEYFGKKYGFPVEKTIVIENKLIRPYRKSSLNKPKESNKITIGYFGVMRCERSWSILKELAKNSPESFNVYLRGKPMAIPDIVDQISDLDNIDYGGMYKSPDDLSKLYERVDIVWAAYPFSNAKDGNWKYARTIRFYEACAFKRPVIVQEGTPQAKEVQKYNIGIVLDMRDVESAANNLKTQITASRLTEWEQNLVNIPEYEYLHGSEYCELYKVICSI